MLPGKCQQGIAYNDEYIIVMKSINMLSHDSQIGF